MRTILFLRAHDHMVIYVNILRKTLVRFGGVWSATTRCITNVLLAHKNQVTSDLAPLPKDEDSQINDQTEWEGAKYA